MDNKGGLSSNPDKVKFSREPSIEWELWEIFAPYGLTRREIEMLKWVAKGKTNNEMGIIFHISLRTVSTHLRKIYIKFGVESRVEAVVRFIEILQHAGKLEK